MYKISKEFNFSASHILSGLKDGHPCGRLHGHNYVIVVELSGERLNEHGFIKDYRELDLIKRYIDEELDHKHLNDVFTFQPSAENMAKFMFEVFKNIVPEVSAITVKETPKTAARYEL